MIRQRADGDVTLRAEQLDARRDSLHGIHVSHPPFAVYIVNLVYERLRYIRRWEEKRMRRKEWKIGGLFVLLYMLGR